MTLKVGMKVWSGNPLSNIRASAHVGDFTEVMIEPDVPFERLKSIDTQWVIHCPHMKFGFNPANRERWDACKRILEYCQEAADFLKADKIIVHPGYVENESQTATSRKNVYSFFEQFPDKRILLENLSLVYFDDNKKSVVLANTVKDMKELLDRTGYGFCYDIVHAWVSAHKLGNNPEKIIKDFMKLKPVHFHMQDSIKNDKDTHDHLGVGCIDLELCRRIIYSYDQNALITLETPYDPKRNRKEVTFMKTGAGL